MTQPTAESVNERVEALLMSAGRARQESRSEQALEQLESALELARSSPYDVPYEAWTRLVVESVDVLVARMELDKARSIMDKDAAFIKRVNDIMQATGTPDQKRQAAGGWIKVRDRQTQLGLIGLPAPEIGQVTWALGGPTTLAQQRGNVVVLEFWATWCTPCVQAFAELNALHREHGDEGLTIIALTRLYSSAAQGPAEQQSELNTIKNFVSGRDLTFPVGTLMRGETHERYGATGLPAVILVDRAGLVRSAHFGTQDQELRRLVRECLGASA
jgi:thiol-disulfide isomerase/thioredoxin